jgi:hypothetical protein
MAISLKGKIKRRTSETRTVELGHGIQVDVGWPSQEVRSDASRAVKWKMTGGEEGGDTEREVTIESDLESKRIWAGDVIRDIRGLTPALLIGYLRIPMERADVDDLQKDVDALEGSAKGFIPFSVENAQDIFCFAFDDRFSDPIRKTVKEWDAEIRKQEEGDRKKS